MERQPEEVRPGKGVDAGLTCDDVAPGRLSADAVCSYNPEPDKLLILIFSLECD